MGIDCIILNYNDADTTIKLVMKIKDYSVFDNIIVVDNKSSDNSLLKLQKYITGNIILLEADKNGGYGAGNNIGIKYAKEKKTDYVLIANPDTIFEEFAIVALVNHMRKNPECAVASMLSLRTNGEFSKPIAWKSGGFLKEVLSCCVFSHWVFRRHLTVQESEICNDVESINVYGVPGSLVMIDVNYDELLYEEDVFLYCEEKILGNKVKSIGKKTKLYLKANYIHNHSVSINKSINDYTKKKIWLESNRKYIDKKYFPLGIKKIFTDFVFFIARIEYKIQSIIRGISV